MTSQTNNSLLLQGGQVFDAPNLRFQRQDVRVRDGKIAEVAADLPPKAGEHVLGIQGKLLVPGLVDFHLHCFRQGQILSIDAEELAPLKTLYVGRILEAPRRSVKLYEFVTK
jgi:predicted amidohydrolase